MFCSVTGSLDSFSAASKVTALHEQKADWSERAALKKQLLSIDEKDIQFAIACSSFELRDGAGSWEGVFDFSEGLRLAPDQLRGVVHTLVQRVELDPDTRKFTILYRLPVTGVKVATPRGFEPRLPP
jgi:hypothetical protein